MMLYDLGLDISTSVIGVAVCEKDGTLKWFEFFSVPDIENVTESQETAPLILKTQAFSEWLKTRPYFGKVDKCYVEASAKVYKQGQSSAQVLMTLAKMNAMICSAVVSSGVKPQNLLDVNVTKARSSIGFKNKKTVVKGQKKIPVKELVRDYVLETWKNLPIQTRKLKAGPNKGKEIMVEQFADAVDAFVILAGAKKIYDKVSVKLQ